MWGAVVFSLIIAGFSATAEQLSTVENFLGDTKDSRIVSGWEASDGQFPYMIYLRGVNMFGDVSACGGSIIHRRWGMSSARCTAQRVVLIITAGMVNLNRPRVHIETSTYYTAPDYIDVLQPLTQPHDIAIINFNRDLTFDHFLQPIRLERSAERDRDYSGIRLTTSGWGTTWSEGEPTEVLNWVHLVGVSNLVCLLMHNSNFLVQATTVCAGPYNVTSQSICSGDSGVPLTRVDADGVVTQIGVGSFVASWGCHVGFPAGFTRTAHYHDWIRQTTGINFDWSRSSLSSATSDPAAASSTGAGSAAATATGLDNTPPMMFIKLLKELK